MAPPKGKDDKKKTPQGPIIKDARFAHVHRDPRFMRPTKKDSKVTVDSRFSSMLKGKEFSSARKYSAYFKDFVLVPGKTSVHSLPKKRDS